MYTNLMKSRYEVSYYFRIVLNILIYIIFFTYVIYSIIHAKDTGAIIFNILIGILVGGYAGLYEYLRINYDAATKRLVADGNPIQAQKYLKRVEKADFFKTYKTSTQMMNMLTLLDLREFDQLDEYIKKLEDNGIENYDVEIVTRYCQMLSYGEKGNKGKSNTAFKKLISLRDQKDSKGRRKKGAFYFNWEVVNGQHKNYDGDYKSAYNFLKDINEANMNIRELMHYLLAKLTAMKNINIDGYDEIKTRLLKACKNNQKMLDYINQCF